MAWHKIGQKSFFLLLDHLHLLRCVGFHLFNAMFVMFLGVFSFDRRFLFIIDSRCDLKKEREEISLEATTVFRCSSLISKHRSQVKINRCFFIVYYDRRFDNERSVSEITLNEKDVRCLLKSKEKNLFRGTNFVKLKFKSLKLK